MVAFVQRGGRGYRRRMQQSTQCRGYSCGMAMRPGRRTGSDPQNERDEGPSERDLRAFGDVTRDCPKCGASLYDDVEICYKCGYALMNRGETKTKPIWVTIIIIFIILAILLPMARFY